MGIVRLNKDQEGFAVPSHGAAALARRETASPTPVAGDGVQSVIGRSGPASDRGSGSQTNG